ncbi:MAG TPA: molybdopterin-synthase adenylyltransferase MoeB [Vicinamibacterales bacterium]|nr:molybdopterin-synthase adenylyltransferase MoeB [Vicinamibacterales bacterium]
MIAPLTSDELVRYSRHVILPEIGIAGQQRLKTARVLCVGVGGLGSPAALYLAAAGIGTIGLMDDDRVDVTNLQRQVIHGTPDVGRSKLASAIDRLHAINPLVAIEPYAERLNAANALAIVHTFDVIVDGSDNFPTRYLVNDASVLARRPNVYGSVSRFEGQASIFASAGGPCYRCLHPEPPPPGLIPSCAEGGVLGVLPGIIGTIQATETIKIILGIGEPLVGRFLIYDALRMRFREIALRRDPDCPVCGDRPSIRDVREYERAVCEAEVRPTADAEYPATERSMDNEITVTELKALMDRGQTPTILDVREPYEHQICRIEGAVLIPMRELPARVRELDPAADLVVQCRSGVRSANATAWLRQQGFTRARNLKGGILAWIDQVDPSQPKY